MKKSRIHINEKSDDVELLLKQNGYLIENGHFVVVGGKHSTKYVHARLSIIDNYTDKHFVNYCIEKLNDFENAIIATCTVGGITLVHKVLDKIDKTNKNFKVLYGRRVESDFYWVDKEKFEKNKNIIIVNDTSWTTIEQLKDLINSLRKNGFDKIKSIFVAVNLLKNKSDVDKILLDNNISSYNICLNVDFDVYEKGEGFCRKCDESIPYFDMSKPEDDFKSVILSQNIDKFKLIAESYKDAYEKQDKSIKEINVFLEWESIFRRGMPSIKIDESDKITQITQHIYDKCRFAKVKIEKMAINEILGNLMTLSHIRVESRSLGCSIVAGDKKIVGNNLLPENSFIHFEEFIQPVYFFNLNSYFDVLDEGKYTFISDEEGNIIGLRNLAKYGSHLRSERLLQDLTNDNECVAFYLDRGRGSITVYCKNEIIAIGCLYDITGKWRFSKSISTIDDLDKYFEMPEKNDQFFKALKNILKTLVNKRYGALFVIGNTFATNKSDGIQKRLEFTDPKIKINRFKLKDDEHLVDFVVDLAKVDGAVIIDTEGFVTHASVIIKNTEICPKSGCAEKISSHGGSRRLTAERTSQEFPECSTIYVSQNGRIVVYTQGGKDYPFMAEIQ